MIKGIGTDIIEIDRIARLLEKPRARDRIFTAREQEVLKRTESYAANFAAKEAYAKAMGTGFVGFSLRDVEILRDEKRKPYIVAHGRAACRGKIHVSLTHCRTYAAANVVIEDEE